MIPSSFQFALLALAAFRLTRLVSYDDFPPIVAARAWLLGEMWSAGAGEEDRVEYRRPLLAHLFRCYWCMGWWISLAVYGAWLAAPRPVLLALVPLALSAAVGLIAKNLDP